MKSEVLFKKQRELLRRFIRKAGKTLKDPKILRIITKIYSKKVLSKEELETLKKQGKKSK